MPEVGNEDTQSEQDSMDAELNKQLNLERSNMNNPQEVENQKIANLTNLVQPMNISLFREYLEWFTQCDVLKEKPKLETPKQSEPLLESINN